jgi:hypothetical protein
MVIALYMFALAMIVGGAAVVAQGYGIILNERGWTMVIAGTVAATGGFVLFGIAVVAARRRGVERELAALGQRAGRLDAGALAPPPLPRRTEPAVESPRGETLPAERLPAEPQASPPPADEGPPLGDTPERAVMRAADVIPEPPAAEVEAAPAKPALVAEPTPGPAPAEAAPAEPEPPAEEAPAPAPAPAAPTVIGTYNSGGNSYVMFSDGSIEADTPSGRFRFASLDELKDFIAAGGEDAAARAS